MLDVIYQEETLHNVINSVTRNWRSIAYTTLLALILVYLFSIVGYLNFRDDFVIGVTPPQHNTSEFSRISSLDFDVSYMLSIVIVQI